MTAPREILVFVSYENDEPAERLAYRLLAQLGLERVAVGIDALTGGAELRLHYHPKTLEDVCTYLESRRIRHDIELLS